jgi:hypothetical protein
MLTIYLPQFPYTLADTVRKADTATTQSVTFETLGLPWRHSREFTGNGDRPQLLISTGVYN